MSKQLKTVSILSLLIFVCGCSCLPKPPEIELKQILQQLDKCKVYKVEFKDSMRLKFDRDVSLAECLVDGHFVLTDNALAEIFHKYKEAKSCHDKTCKKGNEWQ